MTELLAEIVANPADDALRAVWADRLLDAEDPWGEFVHLQLALARAGDALRSTHEPRLRELYDEHHQRVEPPPHPATSFVWRRGFIDHVSTSGADFRLYGSRMFEQAPLIRTLETTVGQVVERPFDETDLSHQDEALRWFGELLQDRKLEKLEGLIVRAKMTHALNEDDAMAAAEEGWDTDYEDIEIGDHAIELLTSIELPRLHMLGISRLSTTALVTLAKSPLAARIDRLVAPWLTKAQLNIYLDHPNTSPLRGLVCGELIEHPKLARLEEVCTRSGPLSPSGIRRTIRADGRWEMPVCFDDWVFRPSGPF